MYFSKWKFKYLPFYINILYIIFSYNVILKFKLLIPYSLSLVTIEALQASMRCVLISRGTLCTHEGAYEISQGSFKSTTD